MPLLDHFHPPLSKVRHWDSFHGAWAEAMAIHLNNELLPERYYAEARVTVGNRVEIDVATLEDQKTDTESESNGSPWFPPESQALVPLNFARLDEIEVQVINDAEGPRVVAAVELVSPANKDRPAHRRMFAAKCAAYLQQGISVIVVDVVTQRTGNLQAELLEMFGISTQVPGQAPGELYASAYRTLADKQNLMQLEVWAEVLTIGAEMPTLPLWISPEYCVPLDLEKTYRVACTNRRIAV